MAGWEPIPYTSRLIRAGKFAIVTTPVMHVHRSRAGVAGRIVVDGQRSMI